MVDHLKSTFAISKTNKIKEWFYWVNHQEGENVGARGVTKGILKKCNISVTWNSYYGHSWTISRKWTMELRCPGSNKV